MQSSGTIQTDVPLSEQHTRLPSSSNADAWHGPTYRCITLQAEPAPGSACGMLQTGSQIVLSEPMPHAALHATGAASGIGDDELEEQAATRASRSEARMRTSVAWDRALISVDISDINEPCRNTPTPSPSP